MLIATDGACKRLGKPDCTATGAAWIQTNDDNMLFVTHFEANSTSQRGEIYGLIKGLRYAVDNALIGEDIIIVTDSEYIFNTVTLDWCFKWRQANWITGAGERAKNADLWDIVCKLLEDINPDRVHLQWTKGHLLSYTPGNTKTAMLEDYTGVTLYERIFAMANRPSERGRIIKEFNDNRTRHEHSKLPDDVVINFVVANIMADRLASHIESVMDAAYLRQHATDINL